MALLLAARSVSVVAFGGDASSFKGLLLVNLAVMPIPGRHSSISMLFSRNSSHGLFSTLRKELDEPCAMCEPLTPGDASMTSRSNQPLR